MAISGTDRGNGNSTTSAGSFTVTPGSNFSTFGSWAVLCLSFDNSGAGGTAQTVTVTDTKGNAWTRRSSPVADPGAANAGIEGAIFTTAMTAGLLTTGDTITVTFTTNPTVSKTWTLMEITPTSTEFALAFVQGTQGAATTTVSPTVTTATVTSGNMLVAVMCAESGITQAVTADADVSNGTWSTQQTDKIGATTSGSTISSQRKLLTGTAAQTFNPTLGIASDAACGWIELSEAAIAVVDMLFDGCVFPFSR